MGNDTKQMEVFKSALGIPLPLCYGKVRAVGNLMLFYQKADKSRIAFFALGEGEWDGIDRLWVNRKLIDHTDTSKVHFHPGIDGILGHGLTPDSTGGDQKVDTFFNDLPPWVQPVTFDRKAYLALKIADDPGAPTAETEVLGDYRTTKVRIFDNSGTETSYAYSTNPAWQILDILLRLLLKREALIDAALTTEEKTRINFQSFVDTAADYDYDIGGGVKRIEVNVAFPREITLTAALEQMLVMSRSYLREIAGKIELAMDKARASSFLLKSDHYLAGSLREDEDYLDDEPNHYLYQFNDLDVPIITNIDTVGNSGAQRTANVVTIKCVDGNGANLDHGLIAAMSVLIKDVADASFNGMQTVLDAPTTHTFRYNQTAGNATSGGGTVRQEEQRFLTRTPAPLEHVQHQLAMGQRGIGLAELPKQIPGQFDLGNNTAERAGRLMSNLLIRNLGPDVIPYIAPKQLRLQAWLESVDSSDADPNNWKALIERRPGEIITVHRTVSEEFQGDYEILEMTLAASAGDQGGGGGDSGESASRVIELFLKAYVPEAFSDTAPAQQVPSPAPRNLPVA
jgi:hypothetical protein